MPKPRPRPPAAKKKATFNLDADLHHRLKVTAAVHRRVMGDLVEEAVRRHLVSLQPGKKTA